MNRLVARGAVAAALVATTTVTAPPASAVTSATLAGTMRVGCFGCGEYGPAGNAAGFTVNGIWADRVTTNGPGSAWFTINAAPGALCAASGWLTGTMTVQTDVDNVTSDFDIVHFGGQGMLTVHGVGRGPISMVVTDPIGNPCGGQVSIQFTATVAG